MSAGLSFYCRPVIGIIAVLSMGVPIAAAQTGGRPPARAGCPDTLPALYDSVSSAVVSIAAISAPIPCSTSR